LDRIAELLREEPAPVPQPAQAAGSTSRERAWAPAPPPRAPSYNDFKERVTAPPASTVRRSKRWPVALAVAGIGALAVALAVATAVKRDGPGRAPDAFGTQTSGPASQAQTVPENKPDPVFPPDSEEETPEPSAASRESDPLIPPEDELKPAPTEASSATATDQTAIQGLIYRWAAATRAGDADAQSAFYAPRVDVFYRARNVSRDWIRRNRDEALRKAGDIRTFKVSNLHMQQPTWDRAVVTFDKEWDFAGRKRDRGKVRGELVLLKRNGEWYISSERDVRVLERGA
jgi:ketosteroid isomerase-like protein